MIYFASSADSPSDYKTRFTIASYPLPQNSDSNETIQAIVFCESADSPYAAELVNKKLLEYIFLELHDNLDNFDECFSVAYKKLQAEMLEHEQKPILQLTSVSVVLLKGNKMCAAISWDSIVGLTQYYPNSKKSINSSEDQQNRHNTEAQTIQCSAHSMPSCTDVVSKSSSSAHVHESDFFKPLQNPEFEIQNIIISCPMYLVLMTKKLEKLLDRKNMADIFETINKSASIDPAYDILKIAIDKISGSSQECQISDKYFADMSILIVCLDGDGWKFSDFINKPFVLHETIINNQKIYQLRKQCGKQHTIAKQISIKSILFGFTLNVNADKNAGNHSQPFKQRRTPCERNKHKRKSLGKWKTEKSKINSKKKNNLVWSYPNVLKKATNRINRKYFKPITDRKLKRKPIETPEEKTQSISINIIQFRKCSKLELQNVLSLVEPKHSRRPKPGCPFSINVDNLSPKLTYIMLNDVNNVAVIKTLPCKYQSGCIPDSIKFYPITSNYSTPNNFEFHISENLYGNNILNGIECLDIKNVVVEFLTIINNDNAGSSEICKREMGIRVANYISEEIEKDFPELKRENSSNEEVTKRNSFVEKQLLFTMDLQTSSTNVLDEDNSIKVFILNENPAQFPVVRDTTCGTMNLFPAGTYGSNGGGLVDGNLNKDEITKSPKRFIRKRQHPSSNMVLDRVTCALSNLGCGGNCTVASQDLEIDITKTKKERFDQCDEFELHLQDNDGFRPGIILQDENGHTVNQFETTKKTDCGISAITMDFSKESKEIENAKPVDLIQDTMFEVSPELNAQVEDLGYMSHSSNRSSSDFSESQILSCCSSNENFDEFQFDFLNPIQASTVEAVPDVYDDTQDKEFDQTCENTYDKNVKINNQISRDPSLSSHHEPETKTC